MFLPKKNSCAQNRVGKLTYMFFTDFLHMFTFLKLSGSRRKKFFVKSDFFPKIANFCRKGLPLSKTISEVPRNYLGRLQGEITYDRAGLAHRYLRLANI